MSRILIADDSSFLRGMVSGWLGEQGHDVHEVSDGQDALDAVGAERFDCVLLDLAMPTMGGLEALEAMSRMANSPPVIVVTADIQESTRERCLELGARSLISKPSSREEVTAAVAEVLTSTMEART